MPLGEPPAVISTAGDSSLVEEMDADSGWIFSFLLADNHTILASDLFLTVQKPKEKEKLMRREMEKMKGT